jgi:hypothetical protein
MAIKGRCFNRGILLMGVRFIITHNFYGLFIRLVIGNSTRPADDYVIMPLLITQCKPILISQWHFDSKFNDQLA